MPEIWFPNLGIEIEHLDRVAFTLFGKNVYWYGVIIGLAVLIGVVLAMKEAKRTGWAVSYASTVVLRSSW